jgi:hypothetical protein
MYITAWKSVLRMPPVQRIYTAWIEKLVRSEANPGLRNCGVGVSIYIRRTAAPENEEQLTIRFTAAEAYEFSEELRKYADCARTLH